MKQGWVAGVTALCLLVGCANEVAPLLGSGVQKSEQRSVPEFRKLRASGTVGIELTVGAPCLAEITTDDNLLRLVTTTLQDGVLVVKTAEKMRPKVPARVRLCTAGLDAIDVEGASQATVSKLQTEHLRIREAGAAKLRVSGSATAVDLKLGAASQAELTELSTATANVHVDQAASAHFGYVETLNVTITGPGTVHYRGQPTIKRSVSKLARLIQD